ncbi:MAG: dehydrogenase [Candidatus Hinthialibacteria bacterium]|nr:gfo/Idh/MocA family oxidoreductase [Candidatus Omnitrophica bacterium COP1]
MSTWRFAGINFDHMHMGDLLRMVQEHPEGEIAGICHEDREAMLPVASRLSIPADKIFTDYRECLAKTRPDAAILCPATARHGEWTCKVAEFNVHLFVEKPFAASLAEADSMIEAARRTGKLLAINWPLAWYPPHNTAKRIVDRGEIGELIEVHYYDGNRGPLWHVADKAETSAEAAEKKSESWFYQAACGGGSLLDYLGYGATLGTWFLNGKKPIEVTTVVDQPPGLEVDEHSVTVARYDTGLSKFETRWGTFTDPWTHQPQPKCGFILKGTEGTISSYDYENTIYVQTRDCLAGKTVPVDSLEPPRQNPIQYFIHCLNSGEPIRGPLSPEISRIGQQIVDSAVLSARLKRTVPLVD